MKKQNKFKIIIPSYNNEEWVEPNMASIINQTYTNYDVLYINDASTDSTKEKVNKIINEYNLNNWKVINNPVNKKRGYNIAPYNTNIIEFMENDEDILVFVDGDDWFFNEDVLSKVNEFYNKLDPWMTYGGMYTYPEGQPANPQNSPYNDEVHSNNLYRKDLWRASHLRTFKWWLYKKIKDKHLRYSKTNEYYFHAEDLSTSYPCLEMCPKEKIGVFNFPTYTFNQTPSNRKRGIEREKEAGNDLETEIRNQTPYKTIPILTTVLYTHHGNNGLGNSLFTLAAGYAVSRTYGKEMYSTKPTGYNEYKNNILRNIRLTNKKTNNVYNEKAFSYDKIPNVDAIAGYFQSEKYFSNYRKEILNLFRMPTDIRNYINNKYKKILDGNTCSIHVRRGDYVNLQHRHPLTSLSYFTNAISEITKKYNDTKFIIFSDDINWCKENFDNKKFTFIEGEKDYIDLYMMSLCKHNIISNSTFSWWGAWLNTNPDKKVIAPKNWLGPAANEDIKDIIPNNWKIL